MSHIAYRSDIDGLRAVAVLSVLFFHFDSLYISGGFLGVDIFFVISGYLITSIIYKQKITNSFDFSMFYVKRIKRILPPIFFLLTLVYIFSYILMLPYDFYKVAVSIISVLFFSSNIQYSFRTNDYFSGDSSEWPLLHTWSLSVEEQYYLLFPLILFFLLKNSNKVFLTSLLILSLSSFLLAEYLSSINQYKSISYYLIFTRMGELLVGSILAVSTVSFSLKRTSSNLITISSMFTILFLLFFVDKTFIFPGFTALFICLPVAIIINSENTIVNKLLSNKVLVYIGTLSYSLYLFHWPVLAFYKYIFNFGEENFTPTLMNNLLCFLIILTFTMFSFYCVEKPLRNILTSKRNTFLYYLIIPTFIFIIISSFTIYFNGFFSRFESEENGIEIYSHINKSRCPSLLNLGCEGGDLSSNKNILVYGNSHAEHYFEFVHLISKKYGYNSELYASGGCGLLNKSSKCLFVKEKFYDVKDKADIIIVSYRWDSMYKNKDAIQELRLLLNSLIDSKSKVIVFAQPPSLNLDPKKINNCIRLGLSCDYNLEINPQYPEYNNVIRNNISDMNVQFFDPFTNVNVYDFISNINNFSDKDHLSIYGTKNIYESSSSISLLSND